MGIFWESPGVFLLLSVAIGGGAAFLAGRALAITWRPLSRVILFMVPLAAAVRFFHFALFQETLLSLHYFLVDFVILVVAAVLGYRMTRASQMTTQYSWLYEKAGPFSWRERTR